MTTISITIMNFRHSLPQNIWFWTKYETSVSLIVINVALLRSNIYENHLHKKKPQPHYIYFGGNFKKKYPSSHNRGSVKITRIKTVSWMDPLIPPVMEPLHFAWKPRESSLHHGVKKHTQKGVNKTYVFEHIYALA